MYLYIYYLGHAEVWGNEQADLLASRMPVAGALTTDKEDIVETIYKCLLVKDTQQIKQHGQ